MRKEIGGYIPGDIKSGAGEEGGGEEGDGKPKLHLRLLGSAGPEEISRPWEVGVVLGYMKYSPNARESSMAQDYVHTLQALRAVMVQKRRKLAESLVGSRKGAKAAKRRKKLIELQGEIDVIDDAIADEQLLSPSLREQVAKDRTGEATSSVDSAAEPIELVRARLTELSERLTQTGGATA